MYAFEGYKSWNPGLSDAADPFGALIYNSSPTYGNLLYGTSIVGGGSNIGFVFGIGLNGTDITRLCSF